MLFRRFLEAVLVAVFPEYLALYSPKLRYDCLGCSVQSSCVLKKDRSLVRSAVISRRIVVKADYKHCEKTTSDTRTPL